MSYQSPTVAYVVQMLVELAKLLEREGLPYHAEAVLWIVAHLAKRHTLH